MLKRFWNIINTFKFDGDDGLNERIQTLSDKSLLQMFFQNSSQYRQKAIDYAKLEIERRGFSQVNLDKYKSIIEREIWSYQILKESIKWDLILVLYIFFLYNVWRLSVNFETGHFSSFGFGIFITSLVPLGFFLYKRKQLLKRRVEAVGRIFNKDEFPESSILYLRSFSDDKTASQIVGWTTEEEQIASVFDAIAPFVAVGLNKPELPEVGASRFYIGDNWRNEIPELMEKSFALVLRIGDGEGFFWEVEQVFGKKLISPERLILLVPSNIRIYETFRKQIEMFGFFEFPKNPTGHKIGTLIGYIYFTKDWKPIYIGFPSEGWLGGRYEFPFVRYKFKYAFQPFFEQIGIELKVNLERTVFNRKLFKLILILVWLPVVLGIIVLIILAASSWLFPIK